MSNQEGRYPALTAPEFWQGSVGGLLRERGRKEGEKKFFKCSGDWRTFGDVDAVTDRIGAGFNTAGINQGDRVVVIAANRDELIETFFACAKTGAIQVPLNIFLKGDFLAYQVHDSDAQFAVVDAAGWEGLRPILDRTALKHIFALDAIDNVPAGITVTDFAALKSSDGPAPDVELGSADILSILYTSGTTGMPKGCMLPNGYYRHVPYQYLRDGKYAPGDRLITAWPFFHTSAQVLALMLALAVPAELVLLQSFSASAFMDTARAEGATVALGVAAMALAILKQPVRPDDGDPGKLRDMYFLPLAAEAQDEMAARFNVRVFGEGYGQTECMPMVHMHDANRRRSACGVETEDFELGIMDDNGNLLPAGSVGEIVSRPRWGNIMYAGYWRKPEATLGEMAQYWHHTGDLGRLDDDGYLYFVDRKQQSMRRRGENVSSIELEAAIRKHPAVDEVAVHAVPSDLSEDEIKAVIIARGGEAPDLGELFEYFVGSLPYFAVPRYVEFRRELPVNAMGRVMKHLLKAEGITPETIDLTASGFVIKKSQRR